MSAHKYMSSMNNKSSVRNSLLKDYTDPNRFKDPLWHSRRFLPEIKGCYRVADTIAPPSDSNPAKSLAEKHKEQLWIGFGGVGVAGMFYAQERQYALMFRVSDPLHRMRYAQISSTAHIGGLLGGYELAGAVFIAWGFESAGRFHLHSQEGLDFMLSVPFASIKGLENVKYLSRLAKLAKIGSRIDNALWGAGKSIAEFALDNYSVMNMLTPAIITVPFGIGVSAGVGHKIQTFEKVLGGTQNMRIF